MPGWERYEERVLGELRDLKDGIRRLEDGMGDVRVEIAMLKVKSGLWGAAAGLLPASIVVAYTLATGA